MGRPRSFDHEQARVLRSNGWTLRAIGDLFGVTHVAVWRVVQDIRRFWTRKHAP